MDEGGGFRAIDRDVGQTSQLVKVSSRRKASGKERSVMLLLVIRIIYAVTCAGAIAAYVSSNEANPPSVIRNAPLISFFLLMAITQFATIVDLLFPRKHIEVVTAIYFGLLIGFLLSYLAKLALAPIVAPAFHGTMILITNLVLPYLCVTLLMQTKDKFRFIIPYIEFSRDVRGGRPYVLDTSSIIDGRIADVIETKIIDAQLVVPSFVLQELQDIADSSDKLRRNRGRRGLDVLTRLQANSHVEVKLHDVAPDDGAGLTVDQRLVHVAKQLGGRVLTNDFNLNKVAGVQGVDVVNLNDLANSLKPRHLPGERLVIKIMRAGESPGQGVGYLEDGTMVVCEEGQSQIGKETEIIVKSVLQSSAGRMLFGRLPGPADK